MSGESTAAKLAATEAPAPVTEEPESGLLAGQTDPAMRETLRGISARLRAQYGQLEAP